MLIVSKLEIIRIIWTRNEEQDEGAEFQKNKGDDEL